MISQKGLPCCDLTIRIPVLCSRNKDLCIVISQDGLGQTSGDKSDKQDSPDRANHRANIGRTWLARSSPDLANLIGVNVGRDPIERSLLGVKGRPPFGRAGTARTPGDGRRLQWSDPLILHKQSLQCLNHGTCSRGTRNEIQLCG